MDSLITAAAQALAAGDVLSALKRVALRDDAPALALRGLAMARLGDLGRAKMLLQKAGCAFGPIERLARARCTVAEAEIALVSRDLAWSPRALAVARMTLERHQDWSNAAHARHLQIRRLLLLGRLNEAEAEIAGFSVAGLPPALATAHDLVAAAIAMRRLRTDAARLALARARHSADIAGIPALAAEVEAAVAMLEAPAARQLGRDVSRALRLDEVEALLHSDLFVIDACRYTVREGGDVISLATRPILFALACALGEAWPDDASRETLVHRAFGARHADESHRARLRVEIGRLRVALKRMAEVRATPRGFKLTPKRVAAVTVLAPPAEDGHPLLALLADGEAWSSSALALALRASQRSVQRALESLARSGKVQSHGLGRARRWMTPSIPGIATTLLLPGPIPGH